MKELEWQLVKRFDGEVEGVFKCPMTKGVVKAFGTVGFVEQNDWVRVYCPVCFKTHRYPMKGR